MSTSTDASEIENLRKDLSTIINKIKIIKETIKSLSMNRVAAEDKIKYSKMVISEILNNVEYAEREANIAEEEAITYI